MSKNGRTAMSENLPFVPKKRNNPSNKVSADKAEAPPIAAICENGESAWVYAIRTQPKPPNGNLFLTYSMKM